MADADLLALLLADARLPVAGHTQSGTLEGAVMAGLGATDVPSYLQARLVGVTRVEAGTAVAARRAVLDDEPLAPVETAWAARTVTPAVRTASRTQARALRRLCGRLWPDVVRPLDPLSSPGRAVVLGAVAAGLGLGAEALARVVAYDDVQTVCAASLKLLPLDPTVVTGWVVDALPGVEEVVAATAGVKSPSEIPAVAAPQIEVWAQAHARTTRRLFRA
ncbi:urease accessory protein UreF [Nocardioides carbamazepini]|uniref:urease accessory protein UreF n=1 Tax=Nocardioides carbamazepini TaxID=2854259 RepID=UPI002149C619|nr:urease accessory UreF family protein [Nocardioides carbamazepini]MCR1780912.1 urease accessory protein UreF [Nocardioides carbamazepini]